MKEAAIERGIISQFEAARVHAEKDPNPNFSHRSRRWKGLTLTFLGLNLLALACTSTQAKEVNQILAEDTNRPAATATQEIQPPTATAEAQKPSPEVKVEADCGLVDPEYRKYAEVIDWKNSRGQILKIVGFRFPPGKKIAIKAAMNGQVAYTDGVGVFKGTRAVVSDPNNQMGTRFEYGGNLITESRLSRNVSQGEDIGYSEAGDLKVIDGYDYDIIVYPIARSTVDEEALRATCPEAFQKPAVFIDLNLANSPRPPTTYTDVFIPRQR